MKKVLIVTPTYNEKENIIELVGKLEKVFEKNKGYSFNLLVVDDSSPDGTGNAVKELGKKDARIILLERKKKEGLGKAYIAGFKHGLKLLEPDIIFQMDADLSHDPKEIPKFLKEIEKGADFVIGSRYIPGGKIMGWGIMRKLTSHGGNILAKYVAGVKVNDATSGYRAMKKEFISGIDFGEIKVDGYAFLTSLLAEAIRKKKKISEVPIVFIDRLNGKTKLRTKHIFEFLFNVLYLRAKK